MSSNSAIMTRPMKRVTQRRLEGILAAANGYCLQCYGTSLMASTPRQVLLGEKEVWIASVVFTSPGYGVVGDVGVIVLDDSGGVIGASEQDEVRAATKK